MSDLISRADAIEAVRKLFDISNAEANRLARIQHADMWKDDIIRNRSESYGYQKAMEAIEALPSADAVHGWRIGKPTERGEYTVTVKTMRGGMVESLYYGKPLMPNRKVRGKCWYRSDDEWGDVVYDDTDILAWMPLPKPYKGGDTE